MTQNEHKQSKTQHKQSQDINNKYERKYCNIKAKGNFP